MTKRPFNATIWLHASVERLCSVELLTIGGYDVEMDFVHYLDGNDSDPYLLRCFAGMEPERAYNVTGAYWFEDGSFDLEITGYVEIAPVELSEQPDGYPLPGVGYFWGVERWAYEIRNAAMGANKRNANHADYKGVSSAPRIFSAPLCRVPCCTCRQTMGCCVGREAKRTGWSVQALRRLHRRGAPGNHKGITTMTEQSQPDFADSVDTTRLDAPLGAEECQRLVNGLQKLDGMRRR